jgi:hypothetical protein
MSSVATNYEEDRETKMNMKIKMKLEESGRKEERKIRGLTRIW